jgi:hypothetical protein
VCLQALLFSKIGHEAVDSASHWCDHSAIDALSHCSLISSFHTLTKVSFFFLFCLTQYVSHAIDLANAYSVVHLFEQPFIPTLRRIALFVSFACMASTTLM